MKETKSQWNFLSFHDHSGIVAYLEKQARKGWLLEKIGKYKWTYRRIEPQELRFAVTYFASASVWDPCPSEEEQTFCAYCEQAGWNLIASNAQLQVFCTEQGDAVPLETDAVLQVENIHKAMKKEMLRGQWIMLVLAILYTAFQCVVLFENPVTFFSSNEMWLLSCVDVNLLLLSVVELGSYYRWHKKAVCEAEETGRMYPSKSHPLFQKLSLVVLLGLLLIWFITPGAAKTKVTMAVSIINMTVLIGAVQACQAAMKRIHASKGMNIAVTLLVDFVLAFLLLGVVNGWVRSLDIGGKEPVDRYVHYGVVQYVYDDPIPLSVEDLTDADPSDYSKELTLQKTALAAKYMCEQTVRQDRDEELPELNYYLVTCKTSALTKLCWNGWIEDYGNSVRVYGRLEEEDPAPWQAEEVYRHITSDGEKGAWFVRWEDRFIRLNADWELTEKQKKLVSVQLVNCAE